MALPDFSMRQLLEAGAHFGHQTHRWNPKMERYIFGARANIHIIDLSQTMPLLHQALVKVREVAASGGRVLFVGTKRQASDPVAVPSPAGTGPGRPTGKPGTTRRPCLRRLSTVIVWKSH